MTFASIGQPGKRHQHLSRQAMNWNKQPQDGPNMPKVSLHIPISTHVSGLIGQSCAKRLRDAPLLQATKTLFRSSSRAAWMNRTASSKIWNTCLSGWIDLTVILRLVLPETSQWSTTGRPNQPWWCFFSLPLGMSIHTPFAHFNRPSG